LDKILVTKDNCEEIAAQLVQMLFDKNLTIVTSYAGPYGSGEPKIVSDVKIASGFSIDDNFKLVIKLIPRRKIICDLATETVYITFYNDHVVLIERGFSDSKKVFRAVVSTN